MHNLLIVGAITSYALFDLYVARSVGQINPYLSAFVFNLIGALLPLAVLLLPTHRNHALTLTSSGIVNSLLAGAAIGVFSVLIILVFQAQHLSTAVPIVYGASMVLASCLGWVFLREPFSISGMLGVLTVGFGLFLIISSKT